MNKQYQQQFFEQTADRMPNAIAVDDHGETITYGALEARANRLAHFLIHHGSGPNERICVFTEKNIEQYIGVLGALKSGGCWVPLSTAFPKERLKLLLQTLRPKAVLVSESTQAIAEELQSNLKAEISFTVIPINAAEESADVKKYPASRPILANRSPEDLAYIIFTSGSTGTPKGVMVLHRSTSQFLSLCTEFFKIAPSLRFAHFSDLTFDPSVFDLFHCWDTGGTLVPFNKRKYRINPGLFFEEQNIQVLFTVPSVLAGLRDSKQLERPGLSCIKHLLLTGEAASAPVLKLWQESHPETEIYNMYGTTETAIVSHWYRLPKNLQNDSKIPVGKPLSGTRVELLNGSLRAAVGESGESVVCGSQISVGYWGNEFLTENAFVPNPIDPTLPQKVYRTGDLLREGPDGLHYYVGRADRQVKVRGHRVELGEVENAILSHPLVIDTAVVAVGLTDGGYDQRLVAFVKANSKDLFETLVAHLESKLPSYMVPSKLVPVIDEMPRNQNGKVDLPKLKTLASELLREKSVGGTA